MGNIVEQLINELQNKEGSDSAEESIMHDLYFGKIRPWENKPTNLPGRKELNNKMKAEEKHLENNLSVEDREHLEALCKMYWDLISCVEYDAFSYGFRLAARLMTEVFSTPVN